MRLEDSPSNIKLYVAAHQHNEICVSQQRKLRESLHRACGISQSLLFLQIHAVLAPANYEKR